VQGTPHYFSPEQARGRDLDGRSDLYSLGVTLFRAATGQLPFEGDDWYDVARQHVETPVAAPRSIAPDLTPEFNTLVLRLIAQGLGHQRVKPALRRHDDLDALAGSWSQSEGVVFEQAAAAFDKVDPDLWK
jgi:serine/threonine-protein kinase